MNPQMLAYLSQVLQGSGGSPFGQMGSGGLNGVSSQGQPIRLNPNYPQSQAAQPIYPPSSGGMQTMGNNNVSPMSFAPIPQVPQTNSLGNGMNDLAKMLQSRRQQKAQNANSGYGQNPNGMMPYGQMYKNGPMGQNPYDSSASQWENPMMQTDSPYGSMDTNGLNSLVNSSWDENSDNGFGGAGLWGLFGGDN